MQGRTQQQIMEAVEQLIHSKGLARVTTKEIARATGLSEGALYRHFDHKEEVFFAILMKYLPSFVTIQRREGRGERQQRSDVQPCRDGALVSPWWRSSH